MTKQHSKRQFAAKSSYHLLEVSQGEVDDLGLYNVRDMVDNYKREYGVEIYINLDHSPSVAAAKAGIEAGYEFIHIDFSQAKHDASEEEIIAATKEIVAYAQLTGALVESEPHYFGGGSNVFTEDINYEEIKKTFSTPSKELRPLLLQLALIPSQRQLVICTVSTQYLKSLI